MRYLRYAVLGLLALGVGMLLLPGSSVGALSAIQVVKECTGIVHPGDSIAMNAMVTNPGDTPLGNVTVEDSDAGTLTFLGGDDNSDTFLDTNETWTYTGTYAAPTGTSNTDTVTATGVDALQAVVQDSDQCTTIIINPDIAVVKECTGLVHEGDAINVTATVTNPGDVALDSVSVVDDHTGALSFQSGDTNNDGLLDPGETWVYTGSYAAPAGTSSVDTVTAQGTDLLQDQHSTVQDSDTCTTIILSTCPDADGDAWCDSADNCPSVATPWFVPAGDGDCDGFTDAEEAALGTDALDPCPDDLNDDAWPADLAAAGGFGQHDGTVNILDIVQLTPPVFGSSPPNPDYLARKDFNSDNVINILDIVRLTPPVFGVTCT